METPRLLSLERRERRGRTTVQRPLTLVADGMWKGEAEGVDKEELLSVSEDQFMDFCFLVEGTTQSIRTNKTTIFIGQVKFSFGSPVSSLQFPPTEPPSLDN